MNDLHMPTEKTAQVVRQGNLFDRLIAYFAPIKGVQRHQARQTMALLTGYEADQASPYRKVIKEIRSGEALAGQSAPALRAQARHLERNLDIADNALNVLSNTVIGARGVGSSARPEKQRWRD